MLTCVWGRGGCVGEVVDDGGSGFVGLLLTKSFNISKGFDAEGGAVSDKCAERVEMGFVVHRNEHRGGITVEGIALVFLVSHSSF